MPVLVEYNLTLTVLYGVLWKQNGTIQWK